MTAAQDVSTLGRVPARVWFARPVLDVARDLLGAFVTTRSDDGEVTVRLTEVEAYAGPSDPASHAFRGRNARNAAMFAEPGRLYVYRHLGLHDCVNVVAEPTGQPAAVLLRAGEVVDGQDLAWARRARAGSVDNDRQLARGPARLAVCLGLSLDDNGADLTERDGRVVLHRAELPSRPGTLASGSRVGVGGAGADPNRYPWRLWLTNEPTVSPFRPSYRSPTSGGAPRGATASA
ncbi:MAG: DNA-3-methyladenine glycosylase [Cellulomonas sp.]|nr:DNA-3-methyladenine glycosylase [Cellulomonas sp.]